MVHSTLGSDTDGKTEEADLGSPRNLRLRSQVPWGTQIPPSSIFSISGPICRGFFFPELQTKASILRLSFQPGSPQDKWLNKSQEKLHDQPAIPLTDNLWEEVKRFENPHTYYVDLSEDLWRVRKELIEEYKGVKK